MKWNWKRIAAGSLALVAIAVALFGNTGAALAAGEAAPVAQEGGEDANTRLEHIYERLLLALDTQAWRFQYATELVDRAQQWIDLLIEQGFDVTELEAALAAYQDGLAEAQSYHDEAAAILAEHAGFDEEGHVVDREAAIETLREAGQALREAHRTLVEALADFREAVREWREDLRDSRDG